MQDQPAWKRFKEACAPYWYRGTMTLSPNPWCYEDNPHYFTAWYLKIIYILGYLDSVLEYRDHREACQTPHGIPHRDPDSREAEKISHDELVGMAWISSDVCLRLVKHGRKNFWSLDNRTPKFTWRGWQPRAFYPVAFYYSTLKYRYPIGVPPLWASLLYAIDCLTTQLKPRGNTSGRMQLLLISNVMEQSNSRICRWATRSFLRSLDRKYGTWGALFDIYFPKHPMTEAVRDWKFV